MNYLASLKVKEKEETHDESPRVDEREIDLTLSARKGVKQRGFSTFNDIFDSLEKEHITFNDLKF